MENVCLEFNKIISTVMVSIQHITKNVFHSWLYSYSTLSIVLVKKNPIGLNKLCCETLPVKFVTSCDLFLSQLFQISRHMCQRDFSVITGNIF